MMKLSADWLKFMLRALNIIVQLRFLIHYTGKWSIKVRSDEPYKTDFLNLQSFHTPREQDKYNQVLNTVL